MGKKLLRLVWNLPASFSMPSPEMCRRVLKRLPPAAVLAAPAPDPERLRHPHGFYV
jgi:hypothetical protein